MSRYRDFILELQDHLEAQRIERAERRDGLTTGPEIRPRRVFTQIMDTLSSQNNQGVEQPF